MPQGSCYNIFDLRYEIFITPVKVFWDMVDGLTGKKRFPNRSIHVFSENKTCDPTPHHIPGKLSGKHGKGGY